MYYFYVNAKSLDSESKDKLITSLRSQQLELTKLTICQRKDNLYLLEMEPGTNGYLTRIMRSFPVNTNFSELAINPFSDLVLELDGNKVSVINNYKTENNLSWLFKIPNYLDVELIKLRTRKYMQDIPLYIYDI